MSTTKPDTETGWSKEFPQVSGWYWMRNFRQYRPLPVEVNGNSFGMMYGNGALFFARDAKGAEFLGPFSPSDFEQLLRLRTTALNALIWMDWWKDPTTTAYPDGLPPMSEIITALREALTHTGEQS